MVVLVVVLLCLASTSRADCGWGQVDWGVVCMDDGDCANSGGGCVSNYIACTCLPMNPGEDHHDTEGREEPELTPMAKAVDGMGQSPSQWSSAMGVHTSPTF